MERKQLGIFLGTEILKVVGLTEDVLLAAITNTHLVLDQIDSKLLEVGADRISQMVELANLSSMVGNLFGAEVAKNSNGKLVRNGPHKYPDLLAKSPDARDVEIKVALENNKPKGHLAKAGYYITCRYVLVDENGIYNPSQRGQVVALWEVRFGNLKDEHFNISNTPGDSGKTAVINKDGMEALQIVYLNLAIAPYSERSSTYKLLQRLISNIGK
jgi:hypothetical protein